MWKPNKNGRYLHNGTITDIACAGTRVERTTGNISVLEPIWDGSWSLLSPDWQDGAPNTDQLKRWKWWAVEHDGRFIYCGEVRHCKGLQSVGAGLLNPEFITRSAPIQPNGACLWVPLEVANG